MPRGTRNTPHLPAPSAAVKRRGRKRKADGVPPAQQPQAKAIRVVDSIQVTKARMKKKHDKQSPGSSHDREAFALQRDLNVQTKDGVGFMEGHETIKSKPKSASHDRKKVQSREGAKCRRYSDPVPPLEAKAEGKVNESKNGGKTSMPTTPVLAKMEVDPVSPKTNSRGSSGDAMEMDGPKSPMLAQGQPKDVRSPRITSPRSPKPAGKSPSSSFNSAKTQLSDSTQSSKSASKTTSNRGDKNAAKVSSDSGKTKSASSSRNSSRSSSKKSAAATAGLKSLPASSATIESHIVKPVVSSAPSSAIPSLNASRDHSGPLSADSKTLSDSWSANWINDEDIPSSQLARSFRSIKSFFSNVWPASPTPGAEHSGQEGKKVLSTPPPKKSDGVEIDRKILTV